MENMNPDLAGPVILCALVLGEGILFSRFLSPRDTDGLPTWIQGVFLALLLVPFLLYVGAKLVSIPIGLPALIGVAALLLIAGGYAATRPQARRNKTEKK